MFPKRYKHISEAAMNVKNYSTDVSVKVSTSNEGHVHFFSHCAFAHIW